MIYDDDGGEEIVEKEDLVTSCQIACIDCHETLQNCSSGVLFIISSPLDFRLDEKLYLWLGRCQLDLR